MDDPGEDTGDAPSCSESLGSDPIEAKQIFVLMKRDFRISRNVRAQWYFQHLNKMIKLGNGDEDEDNAAITEEDLEILGATPELDPPVDSYKLTPNSLVYFLGKRYRLVFILDYSPSTAVVDAEQNCVLHDKVFLAFRNFLMGLVQPFRIPSRDELLSPELYVTVLAYTPFLKNRGRQALLQGCLVNISNLYASIRHVEVALQRFLRGVTEASANSAQAWDSNADNGRSKYIVPSDSALIDMIRFGMLAVQLLPENTSAGMIVFTDGVLGLPDASILEALLSQLRVWTISCSFALVRRDGCSPDYAFGKVPNTEMMRFLASATFGVHLDECPNLGPSLDHRLNLYHKAVLCWSFQRALEDYMQFPSIHATPFNQLPCQLLKVRNFSNILATPLQAVLSVRLREGYTVKRVLMKENQIKVELMLPWKYEVNLQYVICSDWPPPKQDPKVKVELCAEGPYEFINDLMAQKSQRTVSPYRALACRTYFDTIQNAVQADKMLVHFNSFCANQVYYTLPEPVKNGAPLFYMLADSEAPVVSSVELQQQQYAPFCQYWRPICLLDMNIWQKWLHTHRVSLLLTHDAPLSAYLHTPSRTNGRYGSVSCRLAVTAIDNALKHWATFTLMDNHSYIKFEYDEPDSKVPSFFYIIRPSYKPPCIVIRLAFLGGICGAVRHTIVGELTERLLSLQISQRSLSSSAPVSVNRSPRKESQLVSDQFVPVKACQQLKKPVEKILVRYDRIPKDLFHMVPFDDLGRSNSSLNSVLCRYLHCKRYLWSLKGSASVLPMNAESASFILQTIVSRCLNDGFRFAYSCDGFLTLFKEYEVTECPYTTCSVQYVVFPPFLSNFLTGGCGSMTRDSVRSDNEHSELESTEADTDALLVTELWIEPQFGFLRASNEEIPATTRLDLFEQFYQHDRDIIRCLVTFEHIRIACRAQCNGGRSRRICWRTSEKVQRSRSGSADTDDLTYPPSPRPTSFVEADQSVVVVPSCFHVGTLFTHSQLLTLLFSSFRRNEKKGESDEANAAFFESLNHELKQAYDIYWVIESYDELHDIWTLITERIGSSSKQSQKVISSCKWFSNVKGRLRSTADKDMHPHRLPKFACYARLLAECRLTLVLCPASFDDVLLLWTTVVLDDEEAGTGEGELSGDDSDGSFSFPVFIFNCCQAMLSSMLSGDLQLLMEDDSTTTTDHADVQIEDFRNGRRSDSVLGAFHRELTLRVLEAGDNSALLHKVHEKAGSLCESINTGAYCSFMESVYSKAFVDGVYRSLQSNYPIHAVDVFSAVDAKCEEFVVGVELTPFLRSACRHWNCTDQNMNRAEKGSTTRRSTIDSTFTLQTYSVDGQPPDAFYTPACESTFHESVRNAFREVLRRSFRSIQTCPDYYFYSPPLELGEAASDGDSFGAASQDDEDQQGIVCFEDSPPRTAKAPRVVTTSGCTTSTVHHTRTTTSFSSAAGGNSSCESLLELVNTTWRTPVFLHLACSIRLRGGMYSCSVQDLPVCLVTIFRECGFKSWDDADLWTQLDIRLELVALAPQHLTADDVFGAEESDWCAGNEVFNLESRLSQSIDHDDIEVSQMLESLKEEIVLLLESEVVFSYGSSDDASKISEKDLREVILHVEKLTGKHSSAPIARLPPAITGSTVSHLQLSFVLKETESLEELKSQLQTLSLIGAYQLVTVDEERRLYYVATKPGSRNRKRAMDEIGRQRGATTYFGRLSESKRTHSFAGFSSIFYSRRQSLLVQTDRFLSLDDMVMLDGRTTSECRDMDLMDRKRRWSDVRGSVARAAAENMHWEKQGYEEEEEEIGLEGFEGYDYGPFMMPSWKERPFRDFWLIIHLSHVSLSAYLLERISGSHQLLWINLISGLKNMIKRVNQTMLLQNLFDTRVCDNLLAPEREDRLWRRNTTLSSDGSESDYEVPQSAGYLAASSKFPLGHFSCPCVSYHWFSVHPRLKANVGRGSANRAAQAMQSLLNKFGVVNRENMFVYKEATGTVFYLRLHENSQAACLALNSMDETELQALREKEWNYEVTHGLRLENVAHAGPNAGNGKKFSLSKWTAKQYLSKILLTVHGVQASSGEISCQLVPALQHRLDDAVLDTLLVTLERNPSAKITLDDVEFLQPVNVDATALRHYILAPIVLNHLLAFSYYLQQHLLEFCFKPNYANSLVRFRAYTETKPTTNLENDIFLYHPRVAGATGVAIICFAFVDSTGYGVPVLPVDQLDPKEGFSAFFRSGFTFESLTKVTEYEPSISKTTPSVLLQFAIWERGEIGPQLSKHLEKCIKRAVCDLVIEYGLLTAPLLENAAVDGTISEPGSPTIGKGTYETTVQAPLRKRHSSAAMHLLGQKSSPAATNDAPAPCSALAVGAPAPGLFSFENFQALVRKATDPQSTVSDSVLRRRHNSQQMATCFRAIQQSTATPDAAIYLNPAYTDMAPRWFDFVHRHCGFSIQRWSFTLESNFSRTLLLREVVEAMRRMLEPEMDVLCFAESIRPMGIVVYESYKPSRSPVVVADEVESTSLDEKVSPRVSSTDVPNSFIIVGFSLRLWKDTMRFGRSAVDEKVPESIMATVRPSRKLIQRFPPLIPSATFGFVPRQRFFHIVVRNRRVTAYVYNCLNEVNSPLERILLRLVSWHNARSRLLNQICLHKTGLFQVPLYTKKEAKENPYYLIAWPEADSFVTCHTPPPQLMKLKSSPSFGSPYRPERSEWLQYLNLNLPSDNRGVSDPVAMQGTRFIQFRNSFLREKDDADLLRSVFHLLSSQKVDMDEELLRIVISRSRLVHTVYTPLLFSPVWREKLASVRRPVITPPSNSSPVTSRSRHDSGPTAIGSRTGSTTGQMTPGQSQSTGYAAPMSPVFTHKTGATLFTTGVESWHAEVQKIMMQHYVRYLTEQLGLKKLSRRFHGQSDSKPTSNGQSMQDIETWTYCLSQKAITFVRCFYSEPYFAVHFYVFDASSLVPDLDTDEDEAEDFSDLWLNLITQSHLHSFSYDFHMRLVASYASEERRNVFKPGYNMNAFLVDFLQYYTCRPPFARTYVFEDRLFAHGMTVSTDQLYNYILDHNQSFGLRVVRMRVSSNTKNTNEPANEYILTSHGTFFARTSSKSDSSIGEVPFQVLHLVMRSHENVDAWKDWLSLKFYVIFVDQTNVFPQCGGPLETTEHGKYHRVRTPSWAVSTETSTNEDGGGGRSTGRAPVRAVDSAPCRIDGTCRRGSSSLRISRRSVSRDRETALERAVSFTAAAVASAAEPASSTSGSSSYSPATAQQDGGYFQIGAAAMAHNRAVFNSADEQIACVDVVDLSEEGLASHGDAKTHARSRSSGGEYSSTSERGTPIRHRLPSLRPVEGSSLHTEQVTYLTYLTDEEFNMQKCLASEAGKFKDKLTQVVKEAASQCKRDLLWKKLLDGVAGDGVTASKRKEDHAGIQLKELETVLKTVHSMPLYSIDSALESLLDIPVSWFSTLLRVLQQKYGTHCRHFICAQDPGRQYLAVLNSNYLDSFVLLAVDANCASIDLRLVYKDYSAVMTAEPSTGALGSGSADVRQYRSQLVHDFCGSFVQALVYHQWTRLLPQ